MNARTERRRVAAGVFCPTLTPLDDALRPDIRKLNAHLAWLVEQGCRGVVLFGTTGEANSFTVAERQDVLERVVDAGFSADRLIVGTGCCSAGDTVALTKHAVEAGCTRVLVLPPFYYKGVTEQGTIDAYAREIDAVADDRLRFFFYRIPQLSGVDITAGVIEALAERFGPLIAGLKDSSGDWSSMEALCRRFGSRLDVLVGSERFLADGMRAGACGCITATANVHPRLICDLFDAPSDALQAEATAAREPFERGATIAMLKAATARRLHDPRWAFVRPPLVAESAMGGQA